MAKLNLPRILFLTLLFIAFSLCLVSTVNAWFNMTFIYEKLIYLNGTSNASPANYPIPINVTWNSHMQPNFIDLRFVNGSDNTALAYWIRPDFVASSWALVYVDVDQPVNGSNYTINMYYGNSSTIANYSGNIAGAFNGLGDDFDDNSFNTSKWYDLGGTLNVHYGEFNGSLNINGSAGQRIYLNYSNGTIVNMSNMSVITRYKFIGGYGCAPFIVRSPIKITGYTGYGFVAESFSVNTRWHLVKYPSALNSTDASVANSWFNFRMGVLGDANKVNLWTYRNDTLQYFNTDTSSAYADGFIAFNYGCGSSYGYNLWDYVAVKQLVQPELVATFETELVLSLPDYVAILTPTITPKSVNQRYLNVTGICNSTITPFINITLQYNGTSVANSSDVANATAFYFNESLASDGQFNYNLTCWKAGNIANYSDNYVLYADTVPPNILINTPANSSQQKVQILPLTINATASDSLAGLDKAVTNDSNWTGVFSPSGSYFNLTNTTAVSNGTHCVNVTVNDTAGNSNSSYVCFTIPYTPCQTLAANYTMTQDQDGFANGYNDTCFAIGANNVGLNCAGHLIRGNRITNAYGIDATASYSGLIIHNCSIERYDSGIYMVSTGARIYNNTFRYNGVSAVSGGLVVYGICTNSIVYNNNFSYSSFSLWASSSTESNVLIENNTMDSARINLALNPNGYTNTIIIRHNKITGGNSSTSFTGITAGGSADSSNNTIYNNTIILGASANTTYPSYGIEVYGVAGAGYECGWVNVSHNNINISGSGYGIYS